MYAGIAQGLLQTREMTMLVLQVDIQGLRHYHVTLGSDR